MHTTSGQADSPLRHLLTRIGNAVSAAAVLSDDCQRYVGELVDGGAPVNHDHHRLQQLDLLSQTLHDLTCVLGKTAARVSPDVTVDLDSVLSSVGLRALACNLAGVDTVQTQPSGDFEMF